MSVGAKFPGAGGCIVGVVALALILYGTACAEPPEVVEPSADKGQTLAERLCSGCHVVETASKTVPAGIPPLRAIANLPGQTATRIMNVLIQPHAPMPDMQLSRQEILDITAYLDTLRTDKSAPTLLPPKQGGKPKYPEPS
jgi:mono/diheme cytochrome c family protein